MPCFGKISLSNTFLSQTRMGRGVQDRAVESKSLKVGKSLKIGKNRIKSEKSDLISY